MCRPRVSINTDSSIDVHLLHILVRRTKTNVSQELGQHFSAARVIMGCVCVCVFHLYEHLSSASSRDEPYALHNGNYRAILCVSTQSYAQRVLNVHKISYLLHGWCHVKPQLSQRKFCVYHTTMHRLTVPLCSKPHT